MTGEEHAARRRSRDDAARQPQGAEELTAAEVRPCTGPETQREKIQALQKAGQRLHPRLEPPVRRNCTDTAGRG